MEHGSNKTTRQLIDEIERQQKISRISERMVWALVVMAFATWITIVGVVIWP